MSTTATRERQSTRTGKARLVSGLVEFEGKAYAVDAIPAGQLERSAFSIQEATFEPDGSWVTKARTPIHEVIRTHDGRVTCDCEEFIDAHLGVDDGTCRHGRALVEAGILPPLSAEAKRLRDSLARRIAREDARHRSTAERRLARLAVAGR